MTIQSLSGDLPHPDYGGWEGFLRTCEVRGRHAAPDGEVVYYGKTNCNYIVFPEGTLIQNYAFHGEALMTKVRAWGWKAVLRQICAERAVVEVLLGKQGART